MFVTLCKDDVTNKMLGYFSVSTLRRNIFSIRRNVFRLSVHFVLATSSEIFRMFGLFLA